MRGDRERDAEFGVNRAARSLASGGVDRDWSRSVQGHKRKKTGRPSYVCS